MKRAAIALVLTQLAFGAGLHCSSTDVVVAMFPAHHDGGTVHHCDDDDDCKNMGFCVKDTCADLTGHCEARPIDCDTVESLVCGCDGVTYWNDCLRKAAGVTAMVMGPCGPGAALCGGTAGDCTVAGASCARVFPSQDRCPPDSPDAPGVCVVLPPTCPPDPGDRLARCDDPTTCDDNCTALKSEKPHLRSGAALCP